VTVIPRESDLREGQVVSWLRGNTQIPSSKLDALHFLNEYRNAWHGFGVHRKGKAVVTWDSLVLRPGKRIPVIHRTDEMTLVSEVVEVLLDVNALRP